MSGSTETFYDSVCSHFPPNSASLNSIAAQHSIITELLTSTIGGVARSKWAHLLVLYGARQWAELTLGPPASTCVAAAL